MINHKLKVTPYPYQLECIEFGVNKQRLFIGDEPGLGKAESLDALIATPNGFVKMGDIQIGQEIFGADGLIHKVRGIYPQGVKPIYCVTFSDGSHCECTLDHLWNVRDQNRRRRNKGWATKSLGDIIKLGLSHKTNPKRIESHRQSALKWEIPMCSPVHFKTKEYIIPPYTLGVFIGDGYTKGTHVDISIPKEKQFIADKIKEKLSPYIDAHCSPIGSIHRYSFVNSNLVDKYHTTNLYMKSLREMNLNVTSKYKFIPTQYLQGDVEQRLDLLRGLLDTDGSCIRNRTAFHTTSEHLAKDVQELVQSLGGIAIIHSYDRSNEYKGIEYQVSIRLNFNPFSPESNKASNWKYRTRANVTRYIQSVEYVGDKECQCIKTTSPDELYLTDEYIVTHNTIESIGIVDTAEAYPALVICPSSLKINWQREFDKFTDKHALVLSDQTRTTWSYLLQMKMFHVAIVNYESLRKFFVWDIKGDKNSFRLKDVVFCPQINMFKSIIIDESHRVKDPSAQQTKFAKGIAIGKQYRILLSGTPVVNRPEDLVAQLSIMGRLNDFGGRSAFVSRYNKESSPADLKELSDRLYDTCMIRREKSKVLTQLPDKTRVDMYVEISNREEYNLAAQDLAEYLRTYKECSDMEIRRKMRMEALVRFMTLRSLSAKGKIKQAADFIRIFIESDKPLIVFCSYHEIVDELCKIFPDAVRVTGRDNATDKQAAVDNFQQGNAKLIICSIKAAGVGLTLTASSNVVFIEFPWTFSDCCQCEDRAHRIGQKDNVTCYYLIGKQTIDRALYRIIHEKKTIANQIMASEDDIPTDEAYFDELVNNLFNDETS